MHYLSSRGHYCDLIDLKSSSVSRHPFVSFFFKKLGRRKYSQLSKKRLHYNLSLALASNRQRTKPLSTQLWEETSLVPSPAMTILLTSFETPGRMSHISPPCAIRYIACLFRSCKPFLAARRLAPPMAPASLQALDQDPSDPSTDLLVPTW